MLTIVVMIGMLLLIAAPRLSRASRTVNVQSAAVDITSRLSMARQTAISRGGESIVRRSGNKLWVDVDQNGSFTLLRDTLFLEQRYGVSLSATMDTIRYNTRGFARLGASQRFQVTRHGETRTVCVMASGLVLPRGCTL
jgi:Tfp pilus assembly protein FimT